MPQSVRIVLCALAVSGLAVVALSVFGPHEFHRRFWDPRDLARTQMKALGDAVEMYVLENRVLPSSLDALTSPSKALGEPYVEHVPLDPWGHPFEYTVVDASRREFRLRSLGPDGRLAVEDDVVYPEQRAR